VYRTSTVEQEYRNGTVVVQGYSGFRCGTGVQVNMNSTEVQWVQE